MSSSHVVMITRPLFRGSNGRVDLVLAVHDLVVCIYQRAEPSVEVSDRDVPWHRTSAPRIARRIAVEFDSGAIVEDHTADPTRRDVLGEYPTYRERERGCLEPRSCLDDLEEATHGQA
jgi:hypothetical protein